MDNPTSGNRLAPQQTETDWYSLSQEKPATRTADRSPQAPGPQSGDQYDYNQGKSTAPNGDATKPGNPSCEKPGQDGRHALTLYDVAERELRHSHTQIKSQDDVYRKLNEIMVAHGHQKANIDDRSCINDHMLPKEWNSVNPRSLLEHSPNGDKPPTHRQHPDHCPPKPEPAPKPEHCPPKPEHAPKPEHCAPRPEHHPHPRPEGTERPPVSDRPPTYSPAPVEEAPAAQPVYPPQSHPYYRHDTGAEIGNVIGGIVGGIGAGFLTGALFGHHRDYGGYREYGYQEQGYQNYRSQNYDYGYQQQTYQTFPPFFGGNGYHHHHRGGW